MGRDICRSELHSESATIPMLNAKCNWSLTSFVLLLIPHRIGSHVLRLLLLVMLVAAEHLLEELELRCCRENKQQECTEKVDQLHFEVSELVQWLVVIGSIVLLRCDVVVHSRV